MMRFAKLAASVAALSMVASPVVAATAQPNPAAKLSLSNAQPVRAATGLKKSSKVAAVVVVLAIIAVGAGLGIATGVIGDGDGDADSN